MKKIFLTASLASLAFVTSCKENKTTTETVDGTATATTSTPETTSSATTAPETTTGTLQTTAASSALASKSMGDYTMNVNNASVSGEVLTVEFTLAANGTDVEDYSNKPTLAKFCI